MKISITANNKQFQAAVDRMVEKQIPFATSLALNRTLSFVRDDDLKKGYQRKFAFRNRAFFQQVHTIRPSKVAHWKKAGVLVAAIQENRLKAPTGAATGRTKGFKVPSNTRFPKNAGNNSLTKGKSADTAFMNKHVTGGVRKPKGRMKAIPYRGAPITRLASTGAVSRGLQPKTLLETFNTGAKNPKNFIIYKKGTHEKNNPASGEPMFIARKVGKGKNQQIQKLYHFTTEIKNKAKYNPEQIVVSGIRRRMPFQFKSALIRAINTARFNV
tara:strand:+ start:1782 stop:2594 length:813 start_codon:yes stop_codon:yes gene_type:complete